MLRLSFWFWRLTSWDWWSNIRLTNWAQTTEQAVDHTSFLRFSFAKSLTLVSCCSLLTRIWSLKELLSISYQVLLNSMECSQISPQTSMLFLVTPLFWCSCSMSSFKLFSKCLFFWLQDFENGMIVKESCLLGNLLKIDRLDKKTNSWDRKQI